MGILHALAVGDKHTRAARILDMIQTARTIPLLVPRLRRSQKLRLALGVVEINRHLLSSLGFHW